MTVGNGKDAFFPCTYNGSFSFPFWRIANQEYSPDNLPLKHYLNNTGIIVSNVNIMMNMWSYTCVVYTYNRTTNLWITHESSTGFLNVIDDTNMSGRFSKYYIQYLE